jgi:hypothetical protein
VERGDLGNSHLATDLAAAVDRHLRHLNIEYDSKRSSLRLGGVRTAILATGTWNRWNRERLRRTGGTAEQYKQPCLVPDHAFREQMLVEEELGPK